MSTDDALTAREFETLDLLETLGNAASLAELAMRLDVTERSVERRIGHAVKAGVVSRDRDERDRMVYRPTPDGRRWYRAALLRMDGVVAPPTLAPAVQRALEATTLFHLTEPRFS